MRADEMYEHEAPEWGEVYDARFGAFNDEAAFYVGEAEQAGGPVLEIGCGTGRILLPIAERGVEGWGVEISGVLLDRLSLKAARQRFSPNTLQADMRAFRLPQRFPLILVPNRAFLHMATTADQITALENFRHHLAPGGRLLLNFYHPGYRIIAAGDTERHHTGAITLPDSGRVFQTYETVRRDRVNQLNQVTFHFEETADPPAARVPGRETVGEPASSDSRLPTTDSRLHFDIPFTHRWIFKAEFGLLLRAAGFERWQVCGGFHGEPLERDDQEMVWTAWA